MRPPRRRARAPTGPRLKDPALRLAEERTERQLPLFDAATLDAILAAAQRTCVDCAANPFERRQPQRASPALALLAERSTHRVAAEMTPEGAVRWQSFQLAARETCADCPLERVRETCGACPLVAFLSTLATDG